MADPSTVWQRLGYPPIHAHLRLTMLGEDLSRFVTHFYLDMMGYNAIANGDDHAPALAELAREISVSDILELLRSHWRPRVMGAWFAAARHEPEITEGVCESLDSCLGYLTLPPLATAAVVHGHPGTIQHLQRYAERDVEHGWGAAEFALAAVDRMAGRRPDSVVPEMTHQTLNQMVEFAHRLGKS